jgi:(p)ppGpp synthase/HD superfamily hydrolase
MVEGGVPCQNRPSGWTDQPTRPMLVAILRYSVLRVNNVAGNERVGIPSTTRLLMAIAFAAEKHRHQRRKDAAASPYINHPIAVANTLAVEGCVTDEAILLAACLHDTVEDTQTTFEEIEESFGTEVSNLVRSVTDDKSLEKAQRKQLD